MEYELSAKLVERNVLAAELDEDELRQSEEFQRLEAQIAALRAEAESKDVGDLDEPWEWGGDDGGFR